jgi:hypothetical protein
MNSLPYYISISFVFIYLYFCFFFYLPHLKRLRKPFFWIQLVIITLLATFFWNIGSGNRDAYISGFYIGLEMVVRAFLVVIGFSALSVELRNPKIKDFLFKKGFKKIYLSLSLAFSTLPLMIQTMVKPGQFFSKPLRSFSHVLFQAEQWLEIYKKK